MEAAMHKLVSPEGVLTDLETGEVAVIAFPATAVAAVATCAAAACAAATCAAFVAKVSIGAQRQVHQPVDPLSARSTPELPRRIGTAARASTLRACTAGKAMASCPDGSLDIIWPVTDSAVT
jgi:hypothetical protein